MTTNLVDRIDIRTDDGTKSIELHHGDIIHMSGEGEADLLLVSSFPGRLAYIFNLKILGYGHGSAMVIPF